jgi:hypothetical protein
VKGRRFKVSEAILRFRPVRIASAAGKKHARDCPSKKGFGTHGRRFAGRRRDIVLRPIDLPPSIKDCAILFIKRWRSAAPSARLRRRR